MKQCQLCDGNLNLLQSTSFCQSSTAIRFYVIGILLLAGDDRSWRSGSIERPKTCIYMYIWIYASISFANPYGGLMRCRKGLRRPTPQSAINLFFTTFRSMPWHSPLAFCFVSSPFIPFAPSRSFKFSTRALSFFLSLQGHHNSQFGYGRPCDFGPFPNHISIKLWWHRCTCHRRINCWVRT